MADEHARLAPSSAHRWGAPDGCRGSVAMEELYAEDDEDSEHAREGTAAHWALERMLAGDTPSLGTLAPNGHPVTPDMLDGALLLFDDVQGTLNAASPGSALRVEQRVYAIETVHPDNWGTPDVYLLDRPRRVLHVWDYKFGHKYVDVYRNLQLVNYAAAILESEGVSLDDATTWRFSFTICQPRCYHANGTTREWHCSGGDLVPLIRALATAALEASAPDAPTRTGEHCYRCGAAWNCGAFLQTGGFVLDVTTAPQPLDMSVESLAVMGRMLATAADRLNSIKDAYDERILGQLRAGKVVPGWAIGHTKPRTVWRAGSTDEMASIGDMFGVDLRKPAELVTPAQARKMGIDGAVIDTYAETPAGSPKLVQSDEAQAARVFGNRN